VVDGAQHVLQLQGFHMGSSKGYRDCDVTFPYERGLLSPDLEKLLRARMEEDMAELPPRKRGGAKVTAKGVASENRLR
jgi:hypothetical protein